MLDHLHQRHGVEAFDAGIAIGERALNELDAGALPFAERIEAQAARGNLKAADADIEAKNFLELPFGHEPLQKLATAAAKVGHAVRA